MSNLNEEIIEDMQDRLRSGDVGIRGILADALTDAGREEEAALCRGVMRLAIVDGCVVPLATVEGARATLQRIRARRQAQLDAAAQAAREANLEATRNALRNLVPPDDEGREVCEVMADSLTIGRADGYPERHVSKEAEALYLELVLALHGPTPAPSGVGLLSIYRRGRPGWADLDQLSQKERAADVAAWSAAREYRGS